MLPYWRDDKRRLRMKVLGRDGNSEVGQQIEPKPQGWEESSFIASAVAEQLQSFITVLRAKTSGIEAQQQGVYLLRHSPQSRFFLCGRHATNQQAARPRSAPICVQPRSADNTGGAHCRVLRPRAGQPLR